MENESDDSQFAEKSKVDMSSEAILNRLDLAAQLLELCVFLGQAKLVGPVTAVGRKAGRTRLANDLPELGSQSRNLE